MTADGSSATELVRLNTIAFVAIFRSAITGWCMLLNPNKNKALVVSISRTVSAPSGDLVLSVVSIRASRNHDIRGMKFDSKRLLNFVDTSVLLRCYFTFVL